MIAYYGNLIILAFRNFVVYVNVKGQKIEAQKKALDREIP